MVEREDGVGRGAGSISRNCGGNGTNLCFGEKLDSQSGMKSWKDIEVWVCDVPNPGSTSLVGTMSTT